MREFGTPLPGITYVDRPGAYGFLRNWRREFAVVKTPVGYFLPGGGVEGNEHEVDALRRELREEIGYTLEDATFIVRTAQYHWSEFYQEHFRKIGAFFEIKAQAPASPCNTPDHLLVWLPPDRVVMELSQEFQRYAATEYFAHWV